MGVVYEREKHWTLLSRPIFPQIVKILNQEIRI